MRRVEALTVEQIERFSRQERSFQVKYAPGAEHSKTSYEFIEHAPRIFADIRKIHQVDDSIVRSVFCKQKLHEIEIAVSSGKGGSFFVKPLEGGLLLKSITKAGKLSSSLFFRANRT